ncbi:FKBP-type peptidyl-prolyl cis-trans isomerase [Fulvivirga lutea]|uniref:Peptidyl-prolyl cis-trans isomerase n=1 Tax=Fulvivirga lutea TaxID=2810512 RepID=A0A974WFH8_9BACT|nr:FKBP-type peptidyl-prolyl cis-trans isomerase [Fulvivirga lutea]QSE97529.1 FKBP-type peptidyl-prolyl cis-trans isomerase [Fulvivirga lutea]
MSKLTICSLLFFAVAMFSCDTNKEVVTESGLKFEYVKEGSGEYVPKDRYLILNMEYIDSNDSLWTSTAKTGMPMIIFKKDSAWEAKDGSVNEIFYQLVKGDSIKFSITARDLFKNTFYAPLPRTISEDLVVNFFIGVEDVKDKDGMDAWQAEKMEQMQKDAVIAAQKQDSIDAVLIDEYLAENNIETVKTESGLNYVMKKEGEGNQPTAGQKVKVNYTGWVLDGAYFDSSIKEVAQEKGLYDERREPYAPIEFELGTGSVIKGWDEGIALLKEGGEATFYIPSSMAYGPRARGKNIPANAILVFDVELVEVVE